MSVPPDREEDVRKKERRTDKLRGHKARLKLNTNALNDGGRGNGEEGDQANYSGAEKVLIETGRKKGKRPAISLPHTEKPGTGLKNPSEGLFNGSC